MAARCCCPPDIWSGNDAAYGPSPTRSSIWRAVASRSDLPTPAYTNGSATLSSVVALGSRLKPWKTKPITRLRRSASWSRLKAPTSRPSNT